MAVANKHRSAVETIDAQADRIAALETENNHLRCRRPPTVYHDTEATRGKLRLNAETIQSLKQAIRHYDNAFKGQMATIDEQTNEIREFRSLIAAGKAEVRRLENLLLSATGRHGSEIADLRDEINEQADTIRERDGTIEGYRKDFRVMVEKIEKLTPVYEECDDGNAVCLTCRGSGSEGARPDDFGHRFTCRACGGSGAVSCSECGEEAES